MKHITSFIIIFCIFLCQSALPGDQTKNSTSEKGISKEQCTYNGIPLKGKVKVVTSFADFKVKVVTSFPDIEVKTVNSFPDRCGEWQFVESFPDFTIQFVESFPDVKIKFVGSFPGMK
jgi:hypothetical protein